MLLQANTCLTVSTKTEPHMMHDKRVTFVFLHPPPKGEGILVSLKMAEHYEINT